MINMINDNYQKHIITIEDPVEFRFKNSKCLINQREVGIHTKSFANALRSSLRESPDVIMVGEMRDAETIQLALTAAETGHLVISTLHTMSASQTINRIIDTFPGRDKEVCRSMLSVSLQGIISQRLIKGKDGGRCAALEIILANTSVRNLIRENKIPQINSIIEIGQRQGMVTMKRSLINLVEDGKITKEKAREVLQSFGQ
jgi:twitching motility protein PilT